MGLCADSTAKEETQGEGGGRVRLGQGLPGLLPLMASHHSTTA